MDEFLGSLQLNQNGDLLLSSSYLTYQNWVGFIAYVPNEDKYMQTKNESRPQLMLSSLKTSKIFDSGVTDAKWTSSENILTGTDNGEICLYKISNQPDNLYENKMIKKEHDSMVFCVETLENYEKALSGSDDARIKIWDLNQEISTRTYKAHDYAVCSLSYNPKDRNLFISCSQDNRALLWDTRKEKQAFLIDHQLIGYPSCSSWSSVDNNLIALGSEAGYLAVYDIRLIKEKPFYVSKIHDRLIRNVQFNSKINLISTTSEDCKTKTFKVSYSSVLNESGLTEIYTSKEHNDYVTGLAWHPVRVNEYLTCSWDGFVKTHCVSLDKAVNGHK